MDGSPETGAKASRPPDEGRDPDKYRLAAFVYDFATWGWSGGAIWRTRARALEHIGKGTRVLIPGMGTGRLAAAAAERGGVVLGIDRSPAMFDRALRRAAKAKVPDGGQLDLKRLDLMCLPKGASFDVVVAEHFLNVFEHEEMMRVREALVSFTAPGGLLVIADFSPLRDEASGLGNMLQRIHHLAPLGGCSLLTGNAMHPIYDHGEELRSRADLVLEEVLDQRSFRVGPRWFRTWIFRKL